MEINKNLKLNKKKTALILSVFLFVVVGVLGYGQTIHAAEPVESLGWFQGYVFQFFGFILQMAVLVVGTITTMIVSAIISIASYNNFINEPSIIMAWGIIRDFSNMFFILILLVIAFATILRIESYNMKKWLPKLLIMAVLINFSRTIAGLIIDFAQVFMLTFVSAIGSTGGSPVEALGIKSYFDAAYEKVANDEPLNLTSTLLGLFLGAGFLIIATIVLGVFLVILLIRTVMLWIYIVLSPLAFLMAAFPGGQKYSSRWWDEFIKNVITGPVLMFFFWLALIASNSFNSATMFKTTKCDGVLQMVCPETFLNFLIAIGMLIGGLIITQQAGGAVGGMASKGMGAINKGKSMAWRGTKTGAAFFPKMGVDKLQQKGYVDLNVKRVWSGIQAKRAEKSREQYAEGQIAAGAKMESGGRMRGLLAMSAAPGEGWNQISSTKGFYQRVVRGGKGMKKRRNEISPDLVQAKFEDDFVNKNMEEREEIQKNLNSEGFAKLAEARSATDSDKKKVLQKEAEEIKRKHDFAKAYRIDDNDEVAVKKMRDEKKKSYDELQSKFDSNTPIYNREARAAEQKLCGEKMSEIKDITDGDEMIRMLKDAIKSKDKAMVKALSKKLAAQGDENEIMQAFGFGTGMEGLHNFSDMLYSKAGFGDQEALTLGSDISQQAKGTNAWAATGAYKMENGQWRKSSQDEQAGFVSSEAVKGHVQDRIRKFGRKAYGEHDESGAFKINAGGVSILRGFDNAKGLKDIADTGNQSAMEHLAKDIDGLQKLVEANVITKELKDAIVKRGTTQGENIEKNVTHSQVREALG